MDLTQHELYQEARQNIMPWLPTEEDRTLATMREKMNDRSLSLIKRYELGSFLYCETMVGVFARLEKTRQWTSRSVYPSKGEDLATRKTEWLIYCYHNYMMVYASVLEVALQLVNEAIDLGIPARECNTHSVSNNRRSEAAGVNSALKNLENTTKRHREGKNRLFHYGKGTRPPVRTGQSLTLDDAAFRRLGLEDEHTRQLLKDFLAIHDQKELVSKMSDECKDIELKVESLFTTILAHYKRIHSFYQSQTV